MINLLCYVIPTHKQLGKEGERGQLHRIFSIAQFAQQNDLHPTDIRALIALLDADRAGTPATPGWLGSQLHLNSASVTALVDRMGRRNLVRREPDPADRRRVILHVTDEATELGASFFGPVIARAVDRLSSFSPEHMATITAFLTAMRSVVE